MAYNVINLHITELCNYRCKHCFSCFKSLNELKLNDWKKIVDKVIEYFNENNISNGRINIAGGEPTLAPYLNELIDYIYSKNIEVSIITNLSKVNKDVIDTWSNKVSMVGVSIDSLDPLTNIKIGRCQNNSIVIPKDTLIDTLNYIKEKGIKLKVNTVVTKNNIDEDLTELYDKVNFDKIKVFQIKINENCNEHARVYDISIEEFNNYKNKVLAKTNKKIIFESSELIESSYVIIDPEGYVISNKNSLHKKTNNLLDSNITLGYAINEVGLVEERFNYRYQKENI